MDQPGWQRAGFTGQGCEKFGDTPVEPSECSPGGWQRAGFDSPECERFVQAAASS